MDGGHRMDKRPDREEEQWLEGRTNKRRPKAQQRLLMATGQPDGPTMTTEQGRTTMGERDKRPKQHI